MGYRPRTRYVQIALLGEARATLYRRTFSDIERLEHFRDTLTDVGHDARGAVLAVFPLAGFSPDMARLAARRGDFALVDLQPLHGQLA